MGDKESVGIIGGGIVGSAIAYFLRELGYGGRVIVYEPDPTYEKTSTFRSAAAIRQQFNLAINVAMSRFGAEFFSELDSRVDKEGAGIGFAAVPYLILAAEGGFDRLRAAHARQVEVGADVDLMGRDELARRFPWLNVEDLSGATVGRSGEGWFDPRIALRALRRMAEEAGATYVQARVTGMQLQGDRIDTLELNEMDRARHRWVVDAAGRHAAKVARFAEITLPIEARKRTAFVFSCDGVVPQEVQLVDPTVEDRGLYLRPYRSGFMAITSPPPDEDNEDFGFEPHENLFDDVIRPALAHRVPACSDVNLEDMWAGHYEMNILDQNAIIGPHPELTNLIFACGFSGHGVMHAPATGRAVAELIRDARYSTLDLSPFSYERLLRGEPLDDIQPSEKRSTATGL